MHEYRVTKYDPSKRRPDGSFGKDDWTSVSDVGQTFAAGILTEDGYLATEADYVEAVRRFLEAGGVTSLRVEGLERSRNAPLYPCRGAADLERARSELEDDAEISGEDVGRVVKLNLREGMWCRLTGAGGFFVHFGYDYYMYLGCSVPSFALPVLPVGLFAEEFRSPYHPELE